MTASMIELAYDPNRIGPGWIAFIVVMSLVVATFLLWRSMNNQLRKIRIPDAGGSTTAPVDTPGGDDPPPAAP